MSELRLICDEKGLAAIVTDLADVAVARFDARLVERFPVDHAARDIAVVLTLTATAVVLTISMEEPEILVLAI